MTQYDVISHEAPKYLGGITAPQMGRASVLVKSEQYEPGLVKNEEAAFVIGRILGVPVVPGFAAGGTWNSIFVADMEAFADSRFFPPVKSDYGYEVSSHNAATHRAFMEEHIDPALRARCAVFDHIISNSDRHEWNFGITPEKEVLLYDHHMCFDTYAERRVPISRDPWYVGEDDLVPAIKEAKRLLPPALVRSIMSGFHRSEVSAVMARIKKLTTWAASQS